MSDEEQQGGLEVDLAGFKELIKALRSFTDPVGKELGEWFAEWLHIRRYLWQVRQGPKLVDAVERATAVLEEHQIPARPVLPKILVPILEGAAIEDDEDMVERWARLLASASAGEDVNPLFPAILARMSSLEAKALQWMWDHEGILSGGGLATHLDLSPWECQSLLDRLQAQQLITLTIGSESRGVPTGRDLAGRIEISFTALGVEFVAACGGPGIDTTARKEEVLKVRGKMLQYDFVRGPRRRITLW